MSQFKLGICIPPRPSDQIGEGRPGEAVGCLRDPILSDLLTRLRAADNLELVEGLNFRQACILSGKVWVGDLCLDELDAFAWYCEVDRRSGSFDLEVLHTLARTTRVVRDPARFEIALDKYRAQLCLRDSGVRVPEFVLFDQRAPHKVYDLLNDWGAAPLKPRLGGWGKGVTLIGSEANLRDTVGYIQSTTSDFEPFYLERYYDNDPQRWVSATMIDGQIAYGYRKLDSKFVDMGEGRQKVLDAFEKGGGVTLGELTESHLEQLEKAYRALGLGLIGFDMIWTESGPMIIDENTSPGNYIELYRELGKEPGQLLADWVLREARDRR